MSSQLHATSRGPAQAPDTSAFLGRCVPPLSGCPLFLQPVTTLALVCRFLSSRDLLSAYKVSRALSAAAASPLTFQHESEWRIDHADKGVETIGPTAVCTGEARLWAAMQSRLFRAFRILKLRAETGYELFAMLARLNLPTAPVLHVLQLEWTSRVSAGFGGFCPSLSFPFVKVLSLQARESISCPKEMMDFPFPRLQVLEIVQTRFPLELLQAWLPVLPQLASTLRQIVIRSPQSRVALADTWPPGVLHLLAAIEAALPDLTEIHWMQQLDPHVFADEIRLWKSEHAGALPQLHKLRSVRCLAADRFKDFDDHVLHVFPAVEDLLLSFRLYFDFHAVDDSAIHTQLSIAGLSRLRRLTLRHISNANDRLMTAPLAGFHRVFQSMPLLEELHLGTLSVPLSAFAHIPRLRTLSMRFLDTCCDAQSLDMPQCFPSLTALCMPSGPTSRRLYTAVSQMPKLRTVQMGTLTPRPADQFVRDGLVLCAPLEEKAENVKQESALQSAISGSLDPSLLLSSSSAFSTVEAAASSRTKRDKRASAAAADATTQPLPTSVPFSFGPHPSHATAPSSAAALPASCAVDAGAFSIEESKPTSQSTRSTAAVTAGGSTRFTTAEALTKPNGADPAANLLFAFAAGAGGKSEPSGAAGAAATAAPVNPFIFTPPSNLVAPADAAPAFSFGPTAAQSNPFAAPLSFAPVAVTPGGPSIASAATVADPTPLWFASWTSAAAASSAGAPSFSFAPAAFAPTTAAPAASLAQTLTARTLSPAFAFSAPPSAFAVAPSAAANPFSSPFVFSAPAGSPFAAAAPAGLPHLAGFNPFAAASPFSSASASVAVPHE